MIELSKCSAERFAAFVAVEERRKDPERQRRCDEERVALQRRHNRIAELPRLGAVIRDLPVVFDHTRLVPGGRPAVHPGRAAHHLAAVRDLFRA